MGGYIDFFLLMLVARAAGRAPKPRGSKSLVISNIVGTLEELKAFLIGGHIAQFLNTFADFVKSDLNIRTAFRRALSRSPEFDAHLRNTVEVAWELLVKKVRAAVESLHADQSKDTSRAALEKILETVLTIELGAITEEQLEVSAGTRALFR